MSSKIKVINRALSRLAQARIISLADNTNAAKLMNEIYDEVAEEVMSQAPWTSVRRRATLSRLNETPEFGFKYAYQLPVLPRCLHVISVNEWRPGSACEWTIEGNKLLTDEESVSIKYLAFIDNAQEYDVDLKNAIVWALVAECCYNFTGKDDTAANLQEKAERMIQKLIENNSMQGSNDIIPSNTFIDVRYE